MTARLKPGTPVAGSADIRTVEQNVAIARMQCANSSEIRAEFRGGILTPNGVFTRNRAVLDAAHLAEAQPMLDAGEDPEHPSGGYVIAIGTEGQEEYLGCMPSIETLDIMLEAERAGGSDMTFLEALIVDATPAADIAALVAAQVEAAESEYLDVDPAPVVLLVPIAPVAEPVEAAAPVPSTFPHDEARSHPIDNAPAGTVVVITPTGHDITFPDGTATRTAPPGDPASALPVGTVIVNHPEGTTTITLPATDARPAVTSVGARFMDALKNAWHWLVEEEHRIAAKL